MTLLNTGMNFVHASFCTCSKHVDVGILSLDPGCPVHGEAVRSPLATKPAFEKLRRISAPLYLGTIVHASSAVSEIYGNNGAIQEADAHRDALIFESAKRANQILPIAIIFPAETVIRRSPPELFTGDEAWKHLNICAFRSFDKQSVPACVLSLLREVTIKDAVIYFDGGETCTMLYEMFRPNDHPTTSGDADIHLRDRTFHPADQGRAYIYIASAGSHNWGHWLTDDLPRVAAAALLLDLLPDKKLTILLLSFGAGIDEARRRCIECHFRLSELTVESLPRFVAHQYDELYYASPVSYHPVIKLRSAINYVRRTYAPMHTLMERRLYVSRPPGDERSLANAEEVEAYMRGAGFEVVDCSAMQFDEQLRLFSEASIVVGIMGAAMTNTVFSSSRTTIVHLACLGWLEPYYWDLAEVCGQRCCYVFGPTTEPDKPAHFARFTISLCDPEAWPTSARGQLCGQGR